MAIGIVIPVYNNWHLTKACLESIDAAVGCPSDRPLVVTVNNGSTDATATQLAARCSPFEIGVENDTNLGFAKACNEGARHALVNGCETVVLLNNDTEVYPGALEALAGAAQEYGIAGGFLLYPDRRTIQHAGMVGEPLVHLYRHVDARKCPPSWRAKPLQCVTGAAMAIKADLWRDLGGLDEGYVNGYEDVDLCFRARVEHGAEVWFEPEAGFIHHEGRTEGRFVKEVQNAGRFYGRWGHVIRADAREVIEADNQNHPVEAPGWLR